VGERVGDIPDRPADDTRLRRMLALRQTYLPGSPSPLSGMRDALAILTTCAVVGAVVARAIDPHLCPLWTSSAVAQAATDALTGLANRRTLEESVRDLFDELFSLADQALLSAKRAGRNSIAVAGDESGFEPPEVTQLLSELEPN
jgi:GGDEF domain-containing protein